MGLILLIVLVLLLLGVVPTWPHSRNWGYGPSGVLGLILVIVLILLLLGYLPRGFDRGWLASELGDFARRWLGGHSARGLC
jgi:Protein of unknown function (DUF3309)